MQERRYRPGDVLDDYCPRERRITDHAIVAMIDDEIRRTRCGVCDAEHEYKEGKVPPPRRKTQPPGLFNQVLEGITGPTPRPAAPTDPTPPPPAVTASPDTIELAAAPSSPAEPEPETSTRAAAPEDVRDSASPEAAETEEPVFRRSLIRATFPRPEGQQPPSRTLPEFTIQSLNNRGRGNGQRQAGGPNKFRGRRRGGNPLDNIGPMRFRDQGSSNGQGHGGGRRRRGGKKNR
jgi:hypothetical protein